MIVLNDNVNYNDNDHNDNNHNHNNHNHNNDNNHNDNTHNDDNNHYDNIHNRMIVLYRIIDVSGSIKFSSIVVVLLPHRNGAVNSNAFHENHQ